MEDKPNITSVNNQQEPEGQSAPFVQKTLGQTTEKPLLTGDLPKVKTGFYHENRFYIWAIVAGVIIISGLSFLAFRKPKTPAPKEANVEITVVAPETAPAGGQAVFQIKINNKDTQKLIGMSLELAYGEGLSFVDSSPNPGNLSGTLFNLGDLSPGQNSPVILKTQVSGNVNDVKKLSLKLHYRLANFNSDFVKEQSSEIRLAASDISVDVTGPASANNAQVIAYAIRYQNNSKNDISGARLKVNYPDGFSFATADPGPDSSNNLWNIPSLPAGGNGTISIQGAFNSASPGESKTITADFQVLGQDGQYFTQNSGIFSTQLSSLPLLVSQELSSTRGSSVVSPGDNLNFTIKYQNNTNVVASGVNILVTLNSKALDFSSVQAEGGQVSNNTISWNAASESALESLSPSEGGQLSFSVRVKNPATKDSSKNLTIVSNIKIKSKESQDYFPGNDVNLKISSPFRLAEALSYQSGSLPPEVGKPTLYAVNFSLTNSTNDFSGGTLTAFIPLGAGGFVAGSVNSAEAGKVQFDAETGKLTWQVGQLPAHSGQFSSSRTLQFGIRIIPSSSQIGNSPTLIKDIKFTATDSFTTQTVNASADDLTTASTGDFQNSQVVQ